MKVIKNKETLFNLTKELDVVLSFYKVLDYSCNSFYLYRTV